MEQSKDNIIFSLIVKGSVYAFLKEKYPDYIIEERDKSKNIQKIIKHFSYLEAFAHIPDKHLKIETIYEKIENFMTNKEFRETKLLEDIEEDAQTLAIDEKEAILNGIIYTTELDNKISKNEKPIIVQIARFLQINTPYKEIIGNYKKSEYKKEKFPIIVLLLGLMVTLLLAGGMYWQYVKLKDTKNYFNKSELVFSEVYFNKFVVYQNRANIQSQYFKKSAVYYLSGKADIGIDVKGIDYEPITKTLTIDNKQASIFTVNLVLNNTIEVDKINPQPISSEDADKMATYVGFAGAIAGAGAGGKATSLLGRFLPKKIQFISTVIGATAGGIIGGGAGYYVTNKFLDGLSLSKKITEKEKAEVIKTAKALIRAKLLVEAELQKEYKQKFEQIIKKEFAKHNKTVSHIIYNKGGK